MRRTKEPSATNLTSEPLTTKALLTVASLALAMSVQGFFGRVVFERVSRYKEEYRAHPIPYDSLMAGRFGLDYMLPKYMVEFMKPDKAVLLVPPADYTRKFITHSSTFSLTNPIYMFYMNSEVRTISANSIDYQRANCTILIDEHGQCYPVKISSRQELETIVQLFKSGKAYNPSGK